MELGKFPCIAWKITNKSKDSLLDYFLKIRPSEHWLLLGFHAAQSDSQLWTSWHCSQRRFQRNNSLARSMDAEFIRYLAGTHHVSEAFQRAGLGSDDEQGWLVYLPACEEFSDGIVKPENDYLKNFDHKSTELFNLLDLEALDDIPKLNLKNAQKLGFQSEETKLEDLENALIGFVLSSEFHS